MTDAPAGGSVFKPAFMLMSGRAVGFIAAFAIPVVLVRIFNQTEFGTYKQLFLLYTTLYGIAQVGMAESLYYFIPTSPEQRGSYIVNSLLALGVSGLLCLGVLSVAAGWLGRWFHNPDLVPYVPAIGLFLLLMLVSAVFEIVMITRKHHLFAFGAYALSDLVRASLFILPALIFHSMTALFAGAIAFAALRFTLVLSYLYREFPKRPPFVPALLKKHLLYAMPFALAVSIETAQVNLHMYVVSAHFDTATFAIYSVGCLQVPLVDFLMTSTSSVMMVRMSEDIREGKRDAALELWLDTTRKLAMVFAALVGGLVVTAGILIPLLFTQAYAASAPLFMVWSLSMFFAAVMTDSVLRVNADTRFLIIQNLIRLAVVAAAIFWFLDLFGLMGAVLVTLLSTLTAKVVGLSRICKLMGCSPRQVLPWRSLAGIAIITVIAMIPAQLLKAVLHLPLLPSLFVTGAVYGLSFVLLLWICGPLKPAEKRMATQWLQLPVTWVTGNRA